MSLGVGGALQGIRIGLVDLDKAGEGFDAKVGERHDAVVARAVDPDQPVLLIHFVGDVPQPVLVLTEHVGDAGDGVDMMNLVDRGQGQAAAAAMTDALGVQFHGSNCPRSRSSNSLFIQIPRSPPLGRIRIMCNDSGNRIPYSAYLEAFSQTRLPLKVPDAAPHL